MRRNRHHLALERRQISQNLIDKIHHIVLKFYNLETKVGLFWVPFDAMIVWVSGSALPLKTQTKYKK
jgi:hypothetical protein